MLHQRAATQNLWLCLQGPSEILVLTNSERLPVVGAGALRDYKESRDGVIEGKQVGRGVWLEELRKVHLLGKSPTAAKENAAGSKRDTALTDR